MKYLEPSAFIGNMEGARRIGLAKWLALARMDCTRKKLKSALGKFVRLLVGPRWWQVCMLMYFGGHII